MRTNEAIGLWNRGLSIIPVPAPDAMHDGKIPTIAWKEFQSRRPTQEEIRGWFANDQNAAIITGAVSGVVAVDVDSPAALQWIRGNLTRTPWQTKTTRGYHLFYRHPGVRVPNRARLHTKTGKLALDVRGDGGYVIAPGSLHASGNKYAFAGDWNRPLEALPVFWVGLLERPRHPEPQVRRWTPTGNVVDRARRYLAAIPRPVIGQGSDEATFSAACKLVRGFEIDEGSALALLREWCPSDFDEPWIEQKIRSASSYGTETLGGRR